MRTDRRPGELIVHRTARLSFRVPHRWGIINGEVAAASGVTRLA